MVDVDELFQWAKAISSQVQEKGLSFNLKELKQDQQKRFFNGQKIVKITIDLITKTLFSLGVKVLAVIADNFNAFWEVLVLTTDDAVALTKKILKSKVYIFRTEIMRRGRTTVSIYKVSSCFIDVNLATQMLQFGDIISGSHYDMRGV